MIEKILSFIFFIFLVVIYENGLFRLTEKSLCKKNKGNCKTCKAWSCEKANQDFKRKKEEL